MRDIAGSGLGPFGKWFNEPGAYVLVDGQFGSTGKGLLAGYIAERMDGRVNKITTNAGPNSGHTAYFPVRDGLKGTDYINDDTASRLEGLQGHRKIVTKQLPVASVFLEMLGHKHDVIVNAGAIIDLTTILEEMAEWFSKDAGTRVFVHPSAALITDAAKQSDKVTERLIASTGKGVGPALVQKIMRTYGKKCIAGHLFDEAVPSGYRSWDDLWDWDKDVVFVETAQGFSLGINSSRFYPTVTSRECTVGQALADARIPAQMLRKVVATFRTYPIRVGNTENSSGEWYPDQTETTWEALGQPPELTTVTKRIRRVATWSWIQYEECLRTNRPDVVFLNFANYINDGHVLNKFINQMGGTYHRIMGRWPEHFLVGFGPLGANIQEYKFG